MLYNNTTRQASGYSVFDKFKMSTLLYLVVISGFLLQTSECRTCINRSLPIHKSTIDVTYQENVVETQDGIKLHLDIEWKVSNLQDSDYDGFIIRIRNLKRYKDRIVPIMDCQASSTHLWMTTFDESICETGNHTRRNCSIIQQPGSNIQCTCPKDSCKEMPNITCSGTPSRLHYFTYYSIPKTRRTVIYEIEFNTEYSFNIYPYDRLWYKLSSHKKIPANFDCPSMLSKSYNLTMLDATDRCCRSNISWLSPFNLVAGDLVPDWSSKTLNVTFNWLPPGETKLLDDMYFVIHNANLSAEEGYPQMTEYSKSEADSQPMEGSELCNFRTTYSSTAYGLLLNMSYVMDVAASYNDYSLRSICSQKTCGTRIKIQTDFNPCDKKWKACEDGTECSVVKTENGGKIPTIRCLNIEKDSKVVESTRLLSNQHIETTTTTKYINVKFLDENRTSTYEKHSVLGHANMSCDVTPELCDEHADCFSDGKTDYYCSCRGGMSGNGINLKYNGTGCSGCPIVVQCHEMADCILDSGNYRCKCLEYYDGDGLKTGTGCNSHAKYLASIIVPVLLLIIALTAFLIWCLCCKKKQKQLDNNDPLQ